MEPKNGETVEVEFCPHCGKAVRDGDKFCAECGEKLGDPESPVIRVAYQALALFAGSLGLHNFYAGFWARAACQLGMTLAGGALWQLQGATFSFSVLGTISGIWAFLEIFFQRVDPQGLPMRKSGCLAQIGIVLLVAFVVGAFGGFAYVFGF